MQIENGSVFHEDIPTMNVYQDEPFQQKVGFDLTPKKSNIPVNRHRRKVVAPLTIGDIVSFHSG